MLKSMAYEKEKGKNRIAHQKIAFMKRCMMYFDLVIFAQRMYLAWTNVVSLVSCG